MKIGRTLLSAALILLGSLGAAEAQVDAQELKRLQGTWTLVSGQMHGQPVAAESVEKSRMTYAGERITLETPHQSGQPITAVVKKLDPKKSPREMDFVRSAGPSPGKTLQAVYEFDGDDRYKICFDPTGESRPKGPGPDADGCHVFHVWQRVKSSP